MIMNKGNLYIDKDKHDFSLCRVFICLEQNKFLNFICKYEHDSIVKNVMRLKLCSNDVPFWNIVDKLPNSAEENSSLTLSEDSLNRLLKTRQIK